MKRIYVTLAERVDRPSDSPADVGELVVLDWETKSVLQRVPIASGQEVKTGRSRGATGIAWHEGSVYVSCLQGLAIVNPYNYRVERVYPIDKLGIPGGLHQIKSHGKQLFLVCTAGDSLAVMQHENIVRVEQLSKTGKDELHFNSIAWDSKGREYHLYMSDKRSPSRRRRIHSRIINRTQGAEIHTDLGKLPHDLLFLDDENLLYCASADGELHLLCFNPRRHQVVFHRAVSGDPGGTYRLRGLMRGLAHDPKGGSVFVGLAPGTICELNQETWAVQSEISFELGSKSAIYDILLDPRDWGLPHCRRWFPSGETASTEKSLAASIRPFKAPVEMVFKAPVEMVFKAPVEITNYLRVVWWWKQLWWKIRGKQ